MTEIEISYLATAFLGDFPRLEWGGLGVMGLLDLLKLRLTQQASGAAALDCFLALPHLICKNKTFC